MDFNSLSPYIRVAWDSTLNESDIIPQRVIFDYEIIYFKEGSGTITIEGNIYSISSGDVFFIRPRTIHSIKPKKGSRLHQPHIHFDMCYDCDSPNIYIPFKLEAEMTEKEKDWFRDDVFTAPPYDLPQKLPIKNIKHFEELLFDVIEEYDMKRSFYQISLKAKFLLLLNFILYENDRNNSGYSLSEHNELSRIKDYICANSKSALTLDDLARQFNLSKFYLTRIFKIHFGISPIHYHRTVRIEKIKEMILYTGYSLTDIALFFGYEDVSVFSRAFKAIEGVAPSELRKNHEPL